MTKFNFIFNILVLVGWLIAELFNIKCLLMGTGLLVLFLLADNLRKLFLSDKLDIWEIYLIDLVFYFFIIVPLFWGIGRLGIRYNEWWFFALDALFFLFNFWKNGIEKKQVLNFKNWLSKNYLLLLVLLIFVFLHKLFFVYYFTIPEWDGYSNILDIRKLLINWNFNFYRPFFNTSVMLMTLISKTDPYILCSTILVWIQSTLPIVAFLLIRNKKIGNLFKFIILTITISIPVLNMEIDIVRPQSILLMFLPVFIWLIIKYESKKLFFDFLLLILIAIFGLGYHELFLIIFLCLTTFFVFKSLVWFLKSKEKKNKLIFLLILLLIITLFFLLAEKVQSLAFFYSTIKKIYYQITNNFHWKWWFLNNYGSDGINIGWSGCQVIKYYAYYMSPIVAVILIWLILNFKKIGKEKFRLSIISVLFLLFSFLSMTEFLPRIGFILLPERCWIFFDIVLITFFCFLVEDIGNKKRRWFLFLILLASLIGIFGSVYIAKEKKSLTDKEEYKASLWIKKNTEKDACFVSQIFNNKMIEFFGERKMLVKDRSYFMSDQIITDLSILKDKEKILKNKKTALELKLKTIDLDKVDTEELTGEIYKYQVELTDLQNNMQLIMKEKSPQYILYSFRKFDNLYSQRSWWREVGYEGANLDKFNKNYDLIYNQDRIFIWKIK